MLSKLSLKQDIHNMDKIMRFVNVKFPRLSPYKVQMRLNTPLKKDLFEHCVQKLGNAVDENRAKCTHGDLMDALINDVENVKQSCLGDCGESSSLIMSMLLANGYKDGEIVRLLFKADAYDMKTNEQLEERVFDTTHEFVVRGLSEKAKSNEPKSYGKNAVVIDAWAGFCANIQEAFKKYYEIFLGGMREYAQPEENVVIKYTPVFERIVAKDTFTTGDAKILQSRFPELLV